MFDGRFDEGFVALMAARDTTAPPAASPDQHRRPAIILSLLSHAAMSLGSLATGRKWLR